MKRLFTRNTSRDDGAGRTDRKPAIRSRALLLASLSIILYSFPPGSLTHSTSCIGHFVS